jgi:hypothetical protein
MGDGREEFKTQTNLHSQHEEVDNIVIFSQHGSFDIEACMQQRNYSRKQCPIKIERTVNID